MAAVYMVLIRKAIVSDSGWEHLSCDEWVAADEQKIENRAIAETLGKELQSLHDIWNQVYACGERISNCPDGVELNLLRSRMMSQRRRIRSCLLEADYPASYKLEIPDMITSQYMARREEIEAAAKGAANLQGKIRTISGLLKKILELCEEEQKCVRYLLCAWLYRTVRRAIEQDDYVLMRSLRFRSITLRY